MRISPPVINNQIEEEVQNEMENGSVLRFVGWTLKIMHDDRTYAILWELWYFGLLRSCRIVAIYKRIYWVAAKEFK